MIINDNGRTYDMDKFSEYSSMTQGIINRLIYSRYVTIRNLLSGSKCDKLKASSVNELVHEQEIIEKIKNIFNFSEEEILFYVQYSIDNFPMIK